MRKALLICGILSSLLYVGINIYVAAQAEGYSSVSQTVSELSAIAAPTRSLWMSLIGIYGLLLFAFGWGVWLTAAAGPSSAAPALHRLQIAGALLIAHAVFGAFWPPMHLRPLLAAGGGSLTDTLHIVWTFVTVVLMMLTMGFGAAALGKRFRIYSIITAVLLTAFGTITGTYAPAIQANLPTPWVGIWERIDIGLFMAWVIVFATALLRRRQVMSHPSAFKTPEGEAAFVAAYDAAMKSWPVPYDELELPSRFGSTYVTASGPRNAPPLVLLHGYMATSTMWAPNVADFSTQYRVFAIDVMGQPGKSIPNEPIRTAADYVTWLNTTLYELNIDRFSLAGMSYGGWLALTYAIAMPQRVEKLVLLSPGGLLPMVREFSVRGMLMTFFPSRLTVNSFMHWLGFGAESASVFELMRLGLRHCRLSPETLRVRPTVFSHDQLTTLNVPTLLLLGDSEVIYDPAQALERALRLMPDVRGTLIPGAHDICVSQRALVDARVIDFLKTTAAQAGRERAWRREPQRIAA